MDYSYGGKFGLAWKNALGQAKIISKKDHDTFNAKGIKFDVAEVIVLPESLFRNLATEFPYISSVRRADKISSFHETFDAELELKIKSAEMVLEQCKYELAPGIRYIYGHFGDPTTWAKVSIE